MRDEDLRTVKDAGERLRDGPGDRALVFWQGGFASCHLPPKGTLVLGRDAECALQIDHASISRRHAALILDEGDPKIVDLGSTNGTHVAGRRLVANEPCVVPHGVPLELGSATLLVHRARSAAARQPTPGASGDGDIVVDPVMKELHRHVAMVAAGTISVLLIGETGVGKEIVAAAIHRASARASRPYVSFNCAALPEALLEGELFGHEKGAFTGANVARAGLLESADGGTVFFDEVGEMPLSAQAKLLRAIELKQILRLGSAKPRTVDVRFVSATNRSLEDAIARGTFREDLFYRLNGVSIPIPPLRERVSEIVPLAEKFIAEARQQLGRGPIALSTDARATLERFQWPGNVRQLRNVAERAALLATSHVIEAQHLGLDQERRPRTAADAGAPPTLLPASPPAPLDDGDLGGELGSLERERIMAALEKCNGNQTHAAQMLGITRRVLMNRLERYGLPRPRKQRG